MLRLEYSKNLLSSAHGAIDHGIAELIKNQRNLAEESSKNPQNRNHFIRKLRLTFLRNGAFIEETSQSYFRKVSYRRIPNI